MKMTTFILFSSILGLLQCERSIPNEPFEADYVLTEEKITYKGQDLPLGKPVTEWEKIFGKYDRTAREGRAFIWDKLGIAVLASWGDDDPKRGKGDWFQKTPTEYFYIFFMNLESPLGQKGKLEEAYGRTTTKFVIEKDKKDGVFEGMDFYKDLIEYETIGNGAAKNYMYPFTTYSKSIDVNGAEVKQGMTIEDINKKRKAADLIPISFLDDNMNWKDEWGSTKTKANGYFSRYGNREDTPYEKSKTPYFHIMFRQTEGEVEHIKIQHDIGQNYLLY